MKNNKGDIRLQFEENTLFHQVAPTSKKQLKKFSNTNIFTTLTPPGSPGVSKEAKLSTEFGALKLDPKPKNFEKPSKNHHFLMFFVISEGFQT